MGGAEATLGHLVRGFAAAGHEVTVYGAGASPTSQEALGYGIGYVPVPVWGGKTGRALTYALNTGRILRTAGPQVVFSLDRTLHQDVYRAGDGCHREWLARRAPFLSPAARAFQPITPFHRAMLWLEARLFADPGLLRVIANSRQVQDEIIRHFQVDPAKIRVIYNGLDHGKFRPLPAGSRQALKEQLGAAANAKIILFVGSGFRRKGLAYLIEAFGGLKDRRSLLWVVGKGSAAPYLKLAARIGVGDLVRFWGPQADTAPFYQAAAVLALPTLYDPCSNVVLEALGCGCPVVTTAANGAREFIDPGENGAVLSQPNDTGGLRQALEAFTEQSQDPRVRQAAAEAVADLDWRHTVSRTLEVLEEAAG
jgi:UDP-glucose:(heptosyl)LPS alpha-1,3-glucosyltransferase